jgi:hypothetical protein
MTTLRYAFLLLAYLLYLPCAAWAQTGSLHGTVRDKDTGEELVGVNVLLVGTATGATTDIEGKYTVRSIQPGTYSVRFSYVGYAPSTVTGVNVKPGDPLRLDMALQSSTVTAEEVVVTAERQLSTESALIAARKKSATIGDGISAEQVKRSPDATAGDALKRVTGLNVVDNKFVFVRGVTDRYNGTMLNGVSVTTTDTDVDKRSFSFDIVPANLLENTTVVKSATPDLPGDFTGGVVQLNTLDFPTSRVLKLSLASSANSITTGADVKVSQGGSRDWLGRDDGTREYTGGEYNVYSVGQRLPNTWAQRTTRAPVNGGFNLSYGDSHPVGEESQLGLIGAVSYRNGYQKSENTLFNPTPGGQVLKAEGFRDQYSVLWGVLGNVSYKAGLTNKFTLGVNYNQSGEDKLTRLAGIDENSQYYDLQVTEWDQRALTVIQLSGSHLLTEWDGLEVAWRGAYSSSIAEEPDYKYNAYYSNGFDPPSSGAGRRSWADLHEFTRTAGLDLTYPLGAGAKVKVGGLVEGKSRNYLINFYQVDPDRAGFDFALALLPIDSIYRQENFGPGKWIMVGLSDPRDYYTGSHELIAAYAMVDVPFVLLNQSLRFAGGVRMENSDLRTNTISPFETNVPYTALLKRVDWLPSANVTWQINEAMNLRGAYSQSLNRPEFRELSSFYFYDYSNLQGAYGNPLLTRAIARNWDLRYEVFPAPGEVLAVSYFTKSISHPIEELQTIAANPELTWINAPLATNRGWEVEFRKRLDFFGGYLENFTITGNYTRVTSEVEVPISAGGIETETREMQGQAPYVVNFSLLFVEPTLGTQVNILFNEFGRRLFAVGEQRPFDLFESPRPVWDLTLVQPIGSLVQAKFSVRDVFARTRIVDERTRNPFRSAFLGTTYVLDVTLAF